MSPLLLTLLAFVAFVLLALFGFGAYRARQFRNAGRPGGGASTMTRGRFLGQAGIAVTPLRPSGVAVVEGSKLEVTTEGAFIAAGSRVRVVAMGRRGYVVRLDVEVTV